MSEETLAHLTFLSHLVFQVRHLVSVIHCESIPNVDLRKNLDHAGQRNPIVALISPGIPNSLSCEVECLRHLTISQKNL
jgi:hypothetical protein